MQNSITRSTYASINRAEVSIGFASSLELWSRMMRAFCPEQSLYDGRFIQFNNAAENPAPPRAFLYEHFKQAVLANMKDAGKVPFLNYDPSQE